MNGDSLAADMPRRPSPSTTDASAALFDLGLALGRALAAEVPHHAEGGGAERTVREHAVYLATVSYALPKDAVANLLRLPTAVAANGDLVLRLTYFRDELRNVLLRLGDDPLPPSVTRTHGGLAVLTTVGTAVAVRADEANAMERVRTLLDDRLALYQRASDASGDHDWSVTSCADVPQQSAECASRRSRGGEVVTTGRR